ncbi:MAG: xanthine dehydrogenase family protein molybdopterin-binding subunit, partial [Acidimicrobiales bacterium]
MLRREDERLLRGDGVYVDDMRPEGLVHMVALRSPAARARLGTIDTSRAAEAPGVLAVLTAEDLQGLPGSMAVTAIEGAEVAAVPVPLLGAGEVRFAGEPVAVVVAESRAAAEDARELVEVDYRSLPVVMDVEESLAARTSLHAAAPDNVLVRWHRRHGDVAAAFAAADHVVSARLNVPRLAAAPIEPRGCIASYDQGKDLLTLWCSAQDPHRPLANLAAVLGRPAERIRVVVPEVGGAFGSKGPLAPEHALAAVCAMRLGRPVKWVEDRTETFLASYQGRGLGAEASLAVDRTGRFLALQARLVADLGAYLYPNTAIVPVTAGMLVTGAYDVPAAEVDVLGVATDKVPTGPYRGAGRPEAAYVVERLTDLAAAELGMDPVDVRRRNLVQPDQFPYRTALGFTYDSGDYEGALVRACELLPYRAWRRQQAAAAEGRQQAAAEGRREGAASDGRRLGIGLAVFVERAGSGLWEGASVDLGPDGRVVVRMGSCPHGQGHETTFAQIAADALGVAPAQVEVRHGDSAEGPPGVGTYGSRSTTVGGSALVVAAEAVLAKARALAAHVLEAAEEDLLW